VCALGTEFIGADELRRIKSEGPARRLVAFVMEEPGYSEQGMGIEVAARSRPAPTSPMLDRGIGLGYLPAASPSPARS
jgi:aminomethyltransferase